MTVKAYFDEEAKILNTYLKYEENASKMSKEFKVNELAAKKFGKRTLQSQLGFYENKILACSESINAQYKIDYNVEKNIEVKKIAALDPKTKEMRNTEIETSEYFIGFGNNTDHTGIIEFRKRNYENLNAALNTTFDEINKIFKKYQAKAITERKEIAEADFEKLIILFETVKKINEIWKRIQPTPNLVDFGQYLASWNGSKEFSEQYADSALRKHLQPQIDELKK
jgi:hypothetical protein